MITGQMNDVQWKHLMSIGRLHNQICGGTEEQSVLSEYVITHEKELAHSMIVETLLENIELTQEFLHENKDYVEVVYRIAKVIESEDIQSLRSIIRVEAFFQLMNK